MVRLVLALLAFLILAPLHADGIINGGSSGSGTVTSITCNGVAITTSGTCSTVGQVPGTATNDNASAGNVGEYVESIIPVGSAISLTSGTPKDITTISLTAGDWDISGWTYFAPAATTSITFATSSISLTANTTDTTVGRWNQFATAAEVDNGITFAVPLVPYRMSLSTTTTIHLVVNTGFTVSTLSGYGGIRARRIR